MFLQSEQIVVITVIRIQITKEIEIESMLKRRKTNNMVGFGVRLVKEAASAVIEFSKSWKIIYISTHFGTKRDPCALFVRYPLSIPLEQPQN